MIHQSFINVLGQSKRISEIDILQIKTTFPEQLAHFKDSNILLEYLEHYGVAIFQDGFIAFINPMEYEMPLKKFPKLKNQSIMPFAKTAMGNFFLIGEVDDFHCLAFYNIQTEEYLYVDDEFDLFFSSLAGSKYYRETDCYGTIEIPALQKHGPVAIDECLTFIPALVHGGSEDNNNIQKVNLNETIEILAKAFS